MLRDSNLGPAVISGFLKRVIRDRVEPAANPARVRHQNSMIDADASVLSKFCEKYSEYVEYGKGSTNVGFTGLALRSMELTKPIEFTASSGTQ